MNIQQVGQFAAVSALTGFATRYVMNRYLTNQTTERIRNIASAAIGLGCGFATRNCSIDTLLSFMGIAIGNIVSLLPLTEDQMAYAELKRAEKGSKN